MAARFISVMMADDHATRRSAVTWSMLGGAAIGAMLLSPNIWRFPSALLPAAVFLVAPVAIPSFGARTSRRLSPCRWALLVLFVCTVAVPVAMAWEGPARGVLPFLPDDQAIDVAMQLESAVLLAFLTGMILWTPVMPDQSVRAQPVFAGLLPRDIAVFVALGLAGLGLAFGSVGALARFLANPAEYVNSANVAAVPKALGLVLRPFLIVGAIGWWGNRVARRRAGALRLSETAFAIVVIVAVGATYSFNRAAFAVPVLALGSAYAAWVRRPPVLLLAVLAVIGVGSLMAIGVYRSSGFDATDIVRDPEVRAFLRDRVHPLDQLQIYGGGPQFTAFLLRANELSRAGAGGTLFGSLVSPVPVFGKPFRAASGPVVYNRLVYGTSSILDQLIPFPGELLINVGLLGTLAAFIVLGGVVRQLDYYHATATGPLQAYVAFYTAAWLLFLVPGSLSSVAQAFVYFFWPIYAILGLQRWHRSPLTQAPRGA